MASFGENLRRERELRGIGLREIADATKISIRFLQALEQDRVEILPGGLFRRAFVRQYAKYVGLDAERLVAEFLYAHGEETPQTGAVRRGLVIPPGALTAVIVVLLLAWLAFPRTPAAKKAEEAQAVPTAPATTTPREYVYPPAAPAPAVASVTPRETSQGLTLTLSAQQDCWVLVSVDGQTVLNRVLNTGESQTVEAEGEIVLSVGNAGGLSFRVNDKPGVPLGKAGEVKRGIVITRQNLPSLLEERSSGKPTSG
jgi:cytoskeletal protein RodZ